MEFAGVKLANSTDENDIYEFLVNNLYEDNALFPLSEKCVREIVKTSLTPTRGVCGIIRGSEGIEASIGMITAHPWYSDSWYLDEVWTYVHPDYRKSDRAKRLIDFAKQISISLATPVVLGIVTKKRLEPKMRLFQRQLQQVGAWFVYGEGFEDMYNQRKVV